MKAWACGVWVACALLMGCVSGGGEAAGVGSEGADGSADIMGPALDVGAVDAHPGVGADAEGDDGAGGSATPDDSSQGAETAASADAHGDEASADTHQAAADADDATQGADDDADGSQADAVMPDEGPAADADATDAGPSDDSAHVVDAASDAPATDATDAMGAEDEGGADADGSGRDGDGTDAESDDAGGSDLAGGDASDTTDESASHGDAGAGGDADGDDDTTATADAAGDESSTTDGADATMAEAPCGDGRCDDGESCGACPADCGPCPCPEGRLGPDCGDCAFGFVADGDDCVPQSCFQYLPVQLRVEDADGQPIAGARLTVAVEDKRVLNELRVTQFPWTPLEDLPIVFDEVAGADGRVTLPADLFHGQPRQRVFHYRAEADGFMGAFIANRACSNFTDDSLVLLRWDDYATAPSAEAEAALLPVKVDFGSYSYWSRIEAAGRPIFFPFVPQVRADLLEGTARVDVRFTVVPANQPHDPVLFPGQDPSFRYEQVLVDVAPGQLMSVRYVLDDPGIYYFYFSFELHRPDGVQIVHDLPNPVLGFPPAVASLADELGEDGTRPSSFAGQVMVFPRADHAHLDTFVPLDPPSADPDAEPIHLVFLHTGFPEHVDVEAVVQAMIDHPQLGLDAVEPFRSNRERFKVWVHDRRMTYEELAFPFDYFYAVLIGQAELTLSQRAYIAHGLRGKTVFFGMISDPDLHFKTAAASGKCAFNKGVTLAIQHQEFADCVAAHGPAFCADDFDLARVMHHEMGHELALLAEEYVVEPTGLFDVEAYVREHRVAYAPHLRTNTHFPAGFDPTEGCFKGKYGNAGYFSGQIFCDAARFDGCEQSAWRDYIGNGCGEDGVMDCAPGDAGYLQEVGCFFGGGPAGNLGYANLLKPTRASMMSIRGEFGSVPDEAWRGHHYGVVNERALCRAIDQFTGGAGGVCDDHCLRFCPDGLRCSEGACR